MFSKVFIPTLRYTRQYSTVKRNSSRFLQDSRTQFKSPNYGAYSIGRNFCSRNTCTSDFPVAQSAKERTTIPEVSLQEKVQILISKQAAKVMTDQHYPNSTPFLILDSKVAFEGLSDREKLYAHHISKAGYIGSLITLIQTSPESPVIFILLDKLFRSQATLDDLKNIAINKAQFTDDEWKALLVYAGAFLANMGNFRGFGDSKFTPDLSRDKFYALCEAAIPEFRSGDEDRQFLSEHGIEPMFAYADGAKQLGFPPNGITTYFSANCTEKDGKAVGDFYKVKRIEGYNTRVFKTVASEAGDQDKYEIRYASLLGTEDSQAAEVLEGSEVIKSTEFKITRGDYSDIFPYVIEHLEKAKSNAANENQEQMLAKYIESFRTGSLQAHIDGSRFWIKDKGPNVESYLGFIETYRDPAGVRGEWEGFVAVVNKLQSEKFARLVGNAESFLKLLPWGQEFEKDTFLKPDFTSLDVVSFAGSGLPIGINIPNYDCIRQTEGFKNVSLGNVMNATEVKSKTNYLNAADNEIFEKYQKEALELQVGLHELLGHGSGKLFQVDRDGKYNFDIETVINPVTKEKVSKTYHPGETYDSVFGSLGSSYEECRAECVGIYLSCFPEVTKLFGFDDAIAPDVLYVNWLEMMQRSLESLQSYSPQSKSWLQAHARARYVILRVLLENGDDLVRVEECVNAEDGKPDLILTLNRDKILTSGKAAIGDFLMRLNVFKATADLESATKMYEHYSEVSDELKTGHKFLKWRNEIIMERKKPRRIYVQPNTMQNGDGAVPELVSYEASPEGFIQSWLDRFKNVEEPKRIYSVLKKLYNKDARHFPVSV